MHALSSSPAIRGAHCLDVNRIVQLQNVVGRDGSKFSVYVSIWTKTELLDYGLVLGSYSKKRMVQKKKPNNNSLLIYYYT